MYVVADVTADGNRTQLYNTTQGMSHEDAMNNYAKRIATSREPSTHARRLRDEGTVRFAIALCRDNEPGCSIAGIRFFDVTLPAQPSVTVTAVSD